jgi:hypothetical protein
MVQLKTVLTPFWVSPRSSQPKDAFYYPQRFLTPLIISTASIIYLTVKVYETLDWIKDL